MANAYAHEPRMRTDERRAMRRASISSIAPAAASLTNAAQFSVLNLFKGIHPVQVLHEGDVVGESELLQDEPLSATTVVTTEAVEIIELSRETFETKLREDFATERGRILRFLQSLPTFQEATMAECYGIASASIPRTVERDHHFLAHPPNKNLGAASFSYSCVCIILSGEARLLAAPLTEESMYAASSKGSQHPRAARRMARIRLARTQITTRHRLRLMRPSVGRSRRRIHRAIASSNVRLAAVPR